MLRARGPRNEYGKYGERAIPVPVGAAPMVIDTIILQAKTTSVCLKLAGKFTDDCAPTVRPEVVVGELFSFCSLQIVTPGSPKSAPSGIPAEPAIMPTGTLVGACCAFAIVCLLLEITDSA